MRFFRSRLARRGALTLVLGLIGAIIVSGCGASTAPVPRIGPPVSASAAEGVAPSYPRTVIDAGDHALTLPARPVRIVSLSAGATETLYAIGAGARIVAVDQHANYPEAALALTKVDYSNPSSEQLIALQPDLVLMARRQRELVANFRGLGLPVLYLGEPATLDDVFDGMRIIAAATGDDADAESLVLGLRERLEVARGRVAEVTAGPRVYYELTPLLHSVGNRSFIGSMLTSLKATNVATGDAAFPQLTAEALIAADPEVILLADVESSKLDLASVRRRPGWDQVSAVRSGRVYEINSDIASRAGPRVIDALELMARALYP